jgi:hypothetical protein
VFTISGLPNRLNASSKASLAWQASKRRYPVSRLLASVNVNDSGQVNKAVSHLNVGCVERPDLIDANDGQVTKQIGVDLVSRKAFANLCAFSQASGPKTRSPSSSSTFRYAADRQ